MASLPCFCGAHLPAASVAFWVQCDRCDRWVHGPCSGYRCEAEAVVEDYQCPPCRRRCQGTSSPPIKMEHREAHDVVDGLFDSGSDDKSTGIFNLGPTSPSCCAPDTKCAPLADGSSVPPDPPPQIAASSRAADVASSSVPSPALPPPLESPLDSGTPQRPRFPNRKHRPLLGRRKRGPAADLLGHAENQLKSEPQVDAASTPSSPALARFLSEVGDPADLFSRCPSLRGQPASELGAKVELLKGLGVNVGKLLTRCPSALCQTLDHLQGMAWYLQQVGLRVPQVVQREPRVFLQSVRQMQKIMVYLEEQRFDLRKVASSCPQVLSFTQEHLQATVRHLASRGLDVVFVANSRPTVLSLTADTVDQTFAFLDQLGLPAAETLNRCPRLLGLNPTTNLMPKVRYLTDVMKLDMAELGTCPAFLCYSLDQRIRPRFEFLQQGIGLRCSLSYFAKCSDADFATNLALRDVVEYRRFLAARGLTPTTTTADIDE